MLNEAAHLIASSLDVCLNTSIRHASFVTCPAHELGDVLNTDADNRLILAGHGIRRAPTFGGHRHAMHAGRIDHVHERLGFSQADRLGKIQLDARAMEQRIDSFVFAQDSRQERRHLAFAVDDYAGALARHRAMGCVAMENSAMGIYFITDPDGYWLEIIPYDFYSKHH